MGYVTDEIQALVGVPGPKVAAWGPLGAGDLRRFVHAVMETNPVHWDPEAARGAGFDAVVAPPLYPAHAFPRAPGAPDPFVRFADEPDWDGSDTVRATGGLPHVDVPLKRLLNGGTQARFFALARVGDVIHQQSRYLDIVDKAGRSGPLVVITIETTYTNQDDELLARLVRTLIRR